MKLLQGPARPESSLVVKTVVGATVNSINKHLDAERLGATADGMKEKSRKKMKS